MDQNATWEKLTKRFGYIPRVYLTKKQCPDLPYNNGKPTECYVVKTVLAYRRIQGVRTADYFVLLQWDGMYEGEMQRVGEYYIVRREGEQILLDMVNDENIKKAVDFAHEHNMDRTDVDTVASFKSNR